MTCINKLSEYEAQVYQKVSQQLQMARNSDQTEEVIDAAMPLGELGLDSLKLVEVIYELETFYQLDVDEELLAELETVGDLVLMMCRAMNKNGIESQPQGELC